MLHMQHVQRYGKMLHGQTLKSATSDYDQRHVIAFRPISVAARSWSYDKTNWHISTLADIYFSQKTPRNVKHEQVLKSNLT